MQTFEQLFAGEPPPAGDYDFEVIEAKVVERDFRPGFIVLRLRVISEGPMCGREVTCNLLPARALHMHCLRELAKLGDAPRTGAFDPAYLVEVQFHSKLDYTNDRYAELKAIKGLG